MAIPKDPNRIGASLVTETVTTLAALDASGITLGSNCYVTGADLWFTLKVSTAALVANEVVAVAGTVGSRWLVEADPLTAITSLTGDGTASGPGAAAFTLANIPDEVTMAGSVLATAIAAPGTPAAGLGAMYVDSTSKNLAVKDDAGVVKHGIQTQTATTNKMVTAVTDAGAVTQDWLPATAFLSFCSVGIDASVTPGPLTATGVKVGDKVVMVANVTDAASAAADFEATVTISDQIQQLTTDLSAKTLVILVIKQSV